MVLDMGNWLVLYFISYFFILSRGNLCNLVVRAKHIPREDLMNHSLDIPEKFLERIAELRNFEKTRGTMANPRECMLLFIDVEKYIWVISPEILMDAVPIIIKKQEGGWISGLFCQRVLNTRPDLNLCQVNT